MNRHLIRNAAQCRLCNDVVESTHRHDWRKCSCGNMYVDGGLDYLRLGYMTQDSVDSLAEWVWVADDTDGESA